MKYDNPAGFSIILALGLMLLLSFTGLYLIEYMLPYARSVKGIENASQAFFESYSGVEDALYDIHSGDIGDEFVKVATSQSDYSFSVVSNGTLLPPVGKGSSEYDADWNALSKNQPVQLLIGQGRLLTGNARVVMDHRVADFDGLSGASNQDTLKTVDGDDEMILWQLSSGSGTLYTEDGVLITESDINTSGSSNLWQQAGVKGNGDSENFRDFYNNNCDDATEECVLKITLIRDIISINNEILPFLEYKIRTSESIPTRLTRVITEGKTYGFTKKLELSVPQQTTNAAFDFTIFQ